MQVGDLVMFRNCVQQGTTGIITMEARQSHLAMAKPELRLYWVLCDTGTQCFTGGQLVLV